MKSGTGKLIAIFVVLAAATLGIKWMQSGKYETGESAQAQESLFPELRKDQVVALTIDGPVGRHVELQKEGEYWLVASADGYRADVSKVDRALEDLLTMKRGKSVSSNLDLAEFGVADDTKITVSASDASGAGVAAVVIGKTSDFRTTFIRVPSEETVRKIDSAVRSRFDVDDGWRDKTILDVGDEEGIDQLTIAGPVDHILFEKEVLANEDPDAEASAEPEIQWNQIHPMQGLAVKWQCETMARALNDLKCDDFYSGEKSLSELGLDPATYTLTAERSEGETTVLFLGDKEGEQYPVKLPDQDIVWLIPSFRAEYFSKPPKDYLQNPPAEELPDAVAEEQANDAEATADDSSSAEEDSES